MLDAKSVLDRIVRQFPRHELVAEWIYRFERREHGAPFAVYFFDFTEKLPQDEEALAAYQERIIAHSYFESEKKSLQWSHYLYFLVDPANPDMDEGSQVRTLIEGDRRYARKFIITPGELDTVIKPAEVAPAGSTRSGSILSIWTDSLEEAGIYDAVTSGAGLEARVQLIENSITSSGRARVRRQPSQPKPATFIRSLQLEQYRPFPTERKFKFGAVNLFSGANGTGKTSLLEAIELFYCGRTRRNPEDQTTYRLSATLADGSTEVATRSRPANVFRDRNLAWYGHAEQNTNYLFQSFARFNFLDTDAAARLTETAAELEESLAKLLVGPEAARMWREIDRLSGPVETEWRHLTRLQAERHEELKQVKARLMEAALITPESDALASRLADMLGRLGWNVAVNEKARMADDLVLGLAELPSLARQATSLSWAGSPVTRAGIAAYLADARAKIQQAGPQAVRLQELRKQEQQLIGQKARVDEAATLAEQAKLLGGAGVPQRTAELRSLEKSRHAEAARLSGLDPAALSRLPSTYLDMALPAAGDLAGTTRVGAKLTLTERQEELVKFQRVRDESVRLAQELRAIAGKILQNNPKPDECPLCHTQFGKGELAKHMHLGLNEQLESAGQELLKKVQDQETVLREAMDIESTVTWVQQFCQASPQPVRLTVRAALAEIERAQKSLAEATKRISILAGEARTLESQGISAARLDEVTGRLRTLGYVLSETDPATVSDLILTLAGTGASLTEDLRKVTDEADSLENNLCITLATSAVGLQPLQRALAEVKERVAYAEVLLEKLDSCSASYPWPDNVPLSELVFEAEAVRSVATDLQAALQKEQLRQDSLPELKRRQEELEVQGERLQAQLERLGAARSTLSVLTTQHSLKHATDQALQENRTVIERIFARIHAPAEFRGISQGALNKLIRKSDGSEAGLSEISTGQRAAFGLSIFLAQNAQLAAGAPPVVLIDDPIAHVDDLNSLSFLDYLREVALTGKRQVFFTTANNKLAALFQRKFDFLGEEFCSFSLTRD